MKKTRLKDLRSWLAKQDLIELRDLIRLEKDLIRIERDLK